MTPREVLLTGVALVLACLLTVETVRRRYVSTRAARRMQQAARRGWKGELRAEELLRSYGYSVVDRQVPARLLVTEGDRATTVNVRADLLIERSGLFSVAEVKTGEQASRAVDRHTRRQILEYQVAFDVSEVLLVLPEQGHVEPVSVRAMTPGATARPACLRCQSWALASLVLGLLIGVLASRWLSW